MTTTAERGAHILQGEHESLEEACVHDTRLGSGRHILVTLQTDIPVKVVRDAEVQQRPTNKERGQVLLCVREKERGKGINNGAYK